MRSRSLSGQKTSSTLFAGLLERCYPSQKLPGDVFIRLVLGSSYLENRNRLATGLDMGARLMLKYARSSMYLVLLSQALLLRFIISFY